MLRKLLLISNSTNAGEAYLSWPRGYIKGFLSRYDIREALFFPWAGVNLTPVSIEKSFDIYEERVQNVFGELGCSIRSIHHEDRPVKAIADAQGIVIGGGNTFHLVKMMYETGVMPVIREKVLQGIPFVGWSAGANVACPTMMTTNYMPICEPPSLKCFNLIPFQINPHYMDANPEGHAGETREQRIMEFLTVNRNVYVAGLREGCLFTIEDGNISHSGKRSLRIFKYGTETSEYKPGEDIGFLLEDPGTSDQIS